MTASKGLEENNDSWMDLMKKEYQMEFSSAIDDGEEDDDSAEESFPGFLGLHASAQLKIVVAVVKKMSIADTEIKYSAGKRALFCATEFGMIQTAQCLVRKAGNLLTVTDEISSNGWLVIACPLGHKEVAHYLYSVTPFNLLHLRNGHQELNFLHLCQYTKYLLYGACLTIVCIIHLKYFCFWQRWIYNCIKQIHDLELRHLFDLRLQQYFKCCGQLAPDFQLDRIFNIALQMQREVQWYKEVECITSPRCREIKNNTTKDLSKFLLRNTRIC